MKIKAYGDTLGDGKVQLSFTLPVKASLKADEAALLFIKKLGFIEGEIVHSRELDTGFTFFIAYGASKISIDFDKIIVDEVQKSMNFYEINDYIKENLKRKIVMVGACTGSDAHTVGIDAIINMKGYDGHYGLERYPMIDAFNLGAQVDNEKLLNESLRLNADAILVSQIVTQKNIHIHNLTSLIELLEAEGVRSRYVVLAGGPRMSNKLAMELGFDAGFGRCTFPEDVASYVVTKIVERRK